MEQGGFDLDFPEPSFYYKVLRKHHVTIHPRRGVKILGFGITTRSSTSRVSSSPPPEAASTLASG
ncbi:hypothetical protein [Streptomyces sp. NPDC058142]|uniref:hypothetical protein n=1 Tax=Streptomyces sp. NPDC058142 TaxID=3346355 RepID=UPI0036DFF53E